MSTHENLHILSWNQQVIPDFHDIIFTTCNVLHSHTFRAMNLPLVDQLTVPAHFRVQPEQVPFTLNDLLPAFQLDLMGEGCEVNHYVFPMMTEPNIFLLPGVELQQYWAPWDEISDAYAIHNVWRCTCSPRDHRDCVPPRWSLPPCAAALRVWPFGTAHRDPGKSLQLETTWAWLSELTYNPRQTILDRWNCRTSIQVYNF